jgi:hypothetical protein
MQIYCKTGAFASNWRLTAAAKVTPTKSVPCKTSYFKASSGKTPEKNSGAYAVVAIPPKFILNLPEFGRI